MSAPSPLADACPKCPPGDFPAVPPLQPVTREGSSLRANYRHEECGYEWSCWWDPDASGWPLPERRVA